MKVTREVIDNSTNSPRLQKFGEYLEQWMEYYKTTEGKSIDLIVLGYDNQYKHNIKFSLTSKENPQHDIFNAINKGIGTPKEQVAIDIFNGIFQYVSNLIVEYPEIEKMFNDNIKRMKENKNGMERKD
jgi:hypothetical protein